MDRARGAASDDQFATARDIYPVSRETFDRLNTYAYQLTRWSKAINLIGASTEADLWDRHILDSLQLLQIAGPAKKWVDLGSGAGLPGMVIACALADVTGSTVSLVESNAKKTAFLRSMRPAVAPQTEIHTMRVEDYIRTTNTPEIVTARALASLSQLFQWVSPWLNQKPLLILPKGRGYEKELSDTDANWSYDLTVHQSRIDPESVVLKIGNLKPR
ncbi:MAG: 16S rRNA (guanine(527)-N(7))-methyltransferase RsmG [Pseudomonadota bacterium]